MVKRKKKSKQKYFLEFLYRSVTVEMKMELVDKVKKLTNEGLT